MRPGRPAWWRRRWLRRAGAVVAGLAAALLIAGVGLGVAGHTRVHRHYASEVGIDAVAVPEDPASIERGRRLAKMVGCNHCHGEDLGGVEIEREAGLYTIVGSNLTSGRGGVATSYSRGDWIRAIRHGIAPSGRGLINMPADYFQALSADDLGALEAYLSSVPAVDRTLPPTEATPLGWVAVGMGLFGEPVPAELVDHQAPVPAATPVGVTVEYGGYLASILNCAVCHGERLTGAHTAGHAAAPDITRTSRLANWTPTDFQRLARTGTTPEGRVIDIEVMPWDRYTDMTDEELEAIFVYLRAGGSTD